jgi:hypothetical protein
VSVLGDTASETNETVHVTLSSPVVDVISDAQGTLTILNDD